MKILFVYPGLYRSGAPKMMAWIANAMAEDEKNRIEFLTYFKHEKSLKLSNSVLHKSLEINRKTWLYNNTIGLSMTVLEITKYIVNSKPDIIVSFGDMFSSLAVINKWLYRGKFIICERGDPSCDYSLWEVFRRKVLYRLADNMVFQTNGAMDFYPPKRNKGNNVIPNPVSIERKERINYSERTDRVVFVGRFERIVKRQDVMLNAFAKLLKDHPQCSNVKLVFYGTGEAAEICWVKNRIAELNLCDNVELAGSVVPIDDYINDAKVFVMTSDHEGIPNALMEAMALGIPCVSTDCSPGGAKILINNGQNGFLVERGDINSISDCMYSLLTDASLSDRIGSEAQKICDRFSATRIKGMWNNFFSGEYNIGENV